MKEQEEELSPTGAEDCPVTSRVLLLCAAVCQCVASSPDSLSTAMYSPKRSSTTNKTNTGSSARKKTKKARRRSSMSESSAADFSEYCSQRRVQRNRAMSACEYTECFLGGELGETGASEDTFPFEKLPSDCKLKILSMLSLVERGVASQVCQEWKDLVHTPSLWHTVDFTSFKMCADGQKHDCTNVCYSAYRNRMAKFFHYLETVQPVIKRLRFAYDIGDYEDSWLDMLQGLLRTARCKDLEFAHLNWKETPLKLFTRDHLTWSTNDYQDFMHKYRHRQRLFVNFLELFTSKAPQVSKLILPFDWSPRSLDCLRKLPELHSLVLEKYFVLQPLCQELLDRLFASVPQLRRLLLEVWTPSGKGMQLYNIQSEILQYLDISQCRGFFLQKVALPSLEVFKVARLPWNGPLTCVDSIHVPCIYDVLRDGAPNLQQLNEHTLHPDWRDGVYEELDIVLRSVCSCRKHKSGWAM